MRIRDIFCSSPASTAVRPSTLNHNGEVTGGRSSVGSHRSSQNPNGNMDKNVPCFSSKMPLIPISRPLSYRRNSFESSSDFRRNNTSTHDDDFQIRRKSSTGVSEVLRRSKSSLRDSSYLLKDHHKSFKKGDDKGLWLSSSDRSKDLIPFRDSNVTSSSPSSSSSSYSSSVTNVSSPAPSIDDQVVVLRVSIHCKGCEGKVRKHISKMEGVTSYTIDIATKKVTVVGKITPLGVVESISQVKFAELWSSSSSSSPSISSRS